jgi:plastocyanin
MRRSGLPGAAVAVCAAAAVTALAGCGGLTDQGDDVVNGKQLFVSKCGSCHVLDRAGTKGVTGPNLDEAFARAREDGFGQSTFKGVVHRQILQPNRFPQVDPATGKTLALMPAKLVEGEDAKDVAAYVASAVAKGGKDSGRLASIGAAEAKGTAKESGGKLAIPADPGGALSYKFANAEASAGQVEIDSKNDSSTPHDIAVEGNGVNETGKIVQGGGTSTVSADLKPGKYQFFCTVPGHREAGMEGTLTVK